MQNSANVLIFSSLQIVFIIINLKKKEISMHFNFPYGNNGEFLTVPSFSNSQFPFPFICPNVSMSSIFDFHFNCYQPYLPLTTVQTLQTAQQQETVPTISQACPPLKGKVQKTRSKNEKKELESAKKNSESNLVNQLFSYFSNYQKSERMVERVIRSLKKPSPDVQKIKTIFYNTVRLINLKRGRRYVNKENILAYYSPENCKNNLEGIANHLNSSALITLEEFCLLFRVCTHHFLKEISLNALLTSKRISSVARLQHLKRRRRVVQAICEGDNQ